MRMTQTQPSEAAGREQALREKDGGQAGRQADIGCRAAPAHDGHGSTAGRTEAEAVEGPDCLRESAGGRHGHRGDPTERAHRRTDPRRPRLRAVAMLVLGLAFGLTPPLPAQARSGARVAQPTHEPAHASRAVPAKPSAHKQVGWASYYHSRFAGRRMADGMRLMSGSDSAASKTLPLGTTARVRNLQNGRSAVVTIRDRGPHAKNRIIDVSPGIARQLGMTHAGVARVEVVVLRYPAARTRRHAERRPARHPAGAAARTTSGADERR